MPKNTLSRRKFLKNSALTLGAAAAAPLILPRSVFAAPGGFGPNDQISLAVIGLGIRGFSWPATSSLTKLLVTKPECRLVAVCDVDRRRRDEAKQYVDTAYGNTACAAYNDFREILDRPDIDAVVIATPDHWHAPMTILACEAGKDVYCEKPLSHTIRQAQAMLRAAQRHGRVVQSGTQSRSSAEIAYACKLAREGAYGRLSRALIGTDSPPRECRLPAEPVPDYLDWDLWLGPAAWRPYSSKIHPERYRDFREFAGGQITDWGHHFFDVAQWAFGTDDTGPVELFPKAGEARPYVTLRYADGRELCLHEKNNERLTSGTTVIGDRGQFYTLAWRGEVESAPAELMAPFHEARQRRESTGLSDLSRDHLENFLDCMRSRKKPNADLESGCRSITLAHLCNIVIRAGRPLRWDPVKWIFPDDAEANRWLDVPTRAPWRC